MIVYFLLVSCVLMIINFTETYEEVDTHVKTTNRRFRIPRVNLSNIDTSQDGDETTKQELQKTKKTRKVLIIFIRKHK